MRVVLGIYEITDFKNNLRDLEEKGTRLQTHIDKLEATLSNERDRAQKAEEENVRLVKQYEKTVDNLISRIANESEQKLNEFKNRLAHTLRSDYQNYTDAMQTPMSEGLGENLKLQLGEMFKQLGREGIRVEGN